MSREAITSNEIASPIGSFSHAVRAGDFVFLSGQVAESPATGKLAAGRRLRTNRADIPESSSRAPRGRKDTSRCRAGQCLSH